MPATLVLMPKKKPTSDRHKPAKMVRIRPRLAAQAEILAARRDADVTQIVNDALRELLEREGLWPIAEPRTDK